MGHYHSWPVEARPQSLVERATEATHDLGLLESKFRLSLIATEFEHDPDWCDIATAAGDIANGADELVPEWLEMCAAWDAECEQREQFERWRERTGDGFFSFQDYRDGMHLQGRMA